MKRYRAWHACPRGSERSAPFALAAIRKPCRQNNARPTRAANPAAGLSPVDGASVPAHAAGSPLLAGAFAAADVALDL